MGRFRPVSESSRVPGTAASAALLKSLPAEVSAAALSRLSDSPQVAAAATKNWTGSHPHRAARQVGRGRQPGCETRHRHVLAARALWWKRARYS
jgi:hypothetical protein